MRLLMLRGWSDGLLVSLGAPLVASALLLALGAWRFGRQTSERVA